MEIFLLSMLELAFGVVALVTALYAWNHRTKPAGYPVLLLLVGGCCYAVVNGLESLAANDLVTVLLGHLRWVLGAAIAIGVFYTAVEFTGRKQFKRPLVVGVLAAFLFVDAVLLLTNPLHGYALADTSIESGTLVYSPGPLLGAHLLLSFALVFAGIVLLVRKLVRNRLYRRQTAAIIAGIGIAAGFFTAESVVTVHPAFNVATVGIVSGSAVLLWAITNVRLLETVPVAREALMDNMDSFIIAIDEDGHVIDINRSAMEFFGVSQEVLGNDIFETLAHHPELVDGIAAGTDTECEISLQRNGQERHYDLRISPITYESGFGFGDGESTLVGKLVVVTDVTENRRRERELDLLKQVFARVLRHNMRNDLNVVQGTAELLGERVEPEHEPLVEKIVDSTDEVLELSEKARDLEAVIESPRTRQAVDVARAIDQAVAGVVERYPEAEITTDVNGSCYVSAHPALETAIKNLVENGCEHQTEPPRTVRVAADAGEQEAEIVIEDDGPGIPEHEITVIRNESETSLHHGSGLGLWIVNWVVNRSDADIDITAGDAGTAVTLRLDRTVPAEGRTADNPG